MTRLAIALLTALLAAPAVAQHSGHDMPMDMSTPMPRVEPAKPSNAADPHAGHNMENSERIQRGAPGMADDAGSMSGPPVQHDAGSMPNPNMAHDMGAMGKTASHPPKAPPPAAAFSGPRHAAETIFDPAVMAVTREGLRVEQGGMRHSYFLADRLETRVRDGRDGYLWDMQGWYGGDINKLWLKSEGEGGFGRSPEDAEFQALYSRAITPWFNLQTGLRYDVRPSPERTHLVVGIQGLLPYVFELDGAAFLSNNGDLTARFEFEYDQRITQRIILQPRVEFNLAAGEIPELGIGSGLSSMEAGLRLRYEFRRELAPYLGVSSGRKLGQTADFARAAGEDPGGWNFVLGVRAWF